MDTSALDNSIANKAVVVRDGARGWRLGACFIEDALDLLGDRVKPEDYEIPDEDDEDYSEIIEDMCQELESQLADEGYTVVFDDGYVIYEDLTDQESEYLFK